MKVTIEKCYNPVTGERYFTVKAYSKDASLPFIKVFHYKENEPEDSIYNEKKNNADAKELADRLAEMDSAAPTSTVIYEREVNPGISSDQPINTEAVNQ